MSDDVKTVVQQQQRQINDLEQDNSDYQAENLLWQKKYGELQKKCLKLQEALTKKRG